MLRCHRDQVAAKPALHHLAISEPKDFVESLAQPRLSQLRVIESPRNTGRSHSFNFDHRRRPETLPTAMATAFFWPTSTTSFLPRVTPVYSRFRCSMA